MLPRLMTRIRQERYNSPGPIVMVDLGRSCVGTGWLCDVTDGRGMLVAMDGMGYDAFHIGSADPLYTQPAIVLGLKEVLYTPFAAGPWSGIASREGIVIGFASRVDVQTAEPADVLIALQLGNYARAEVDYDGQKRTVALDAGTASLDVPLLGRLDVRLLPEPPFIEIISQMHFDIPNDLPPDPTILGIVEFVESEARVAERKRGSRD
jgi:hypothetical protein